MQDKRLMLQWGRVSVEREVNCKRICMRKLELYLPACLAFGKPKCSPFRPYTLAGSRQWQTE